MKTAPSVAYGARLAGVATILVATVIGADARAAGPFAKGPWVQHVGAHGATVRVEIDPPAKVSVEIEGLRTLEDAEVGAIHSLAFEGLAPATRYTYVVRASGASKSATFTTAPADDSDKPFTFLVYGDNRTDDAAHASLVRGMTSTPAEFLVHTGDFVETGPSKKNWQTFFDIEAPLLATRCLYAAVGNHELTDGSGIDFARYFGPAGVDTKTPPTRADQLNGTFRWGNTRFFLLNGTPSQSGLKDSSWLEKSLTDAEREPGLTWRILVVHHGLWSSGPHGGNARLAELGVPALLKKHNVDLVLSGHDHIYERGFAEGLPYVVSGGGGAPLYRIKKTVPEALKVESVHHFVATTISPTELAITSTRSDGSVIERCALSKTAAGWSCNGEPRGDAAAGAPGTTTSAATPESHSKSRCSCDVVGDHRGDSARAFFVVLAAAFVAGVRRRWQAASEPRMMGP